MTLVGTTLRSAYLAGPMRGIPEYNFPAFRQYTAILRRMGWDIFSPAERDEQDPTIDHETDVAGWSGERGLDYFMAFDLKAVCEMDAVILMPGWEASQGARLEAVVAAEIGHPVFAIGDEEHSALYLSSVDPALIRRVFAERGQFAEVEGHRVETDTYKEARWYDPLGCGSGAVAAKDATEDEDWEAVEAWLDGPYEVEAGLSQTGYSGESALPTGSEARKGVPLASGVLDYFPAALAEVARVSKAGNDKHNPGQPMHHARGKSTDHADCLLRHLVDRGKVDPETGQRHSGEVAWRALALLQQELEDAGLAPLPRGARLPEPEEA